VQVGYLSKAAIQYEMSSKQLPGHINDFGWFTGTTAAVPRDTAAGVGRSGDKKLGGWMVPLLPYLDAQPLYEIWSETQYPLLVQHGNEFSFTEEAAPNLPILQCAQSPMVDSKRGRNSYIANTGFHPEGSSGNAITIDRAGTELVLSHDDPENFRNSMQPCVCAFNHQYSRALNADRFPSGPPVRLSDFSDGVAHTVLFSESLQAVAWHQLDPDSQVSAGLLQPASPGDEVPYPFLSRYVQGMVWHNGTSSVMSAKDSLNGNNANNYLPMNHTNAFAVARPSSAHAQGNNFGFADGSMRFITDSIDYRVYKALLTPCGYEKLDEDLSIK
jgi:hypothetical protein